MSINVLDFSILNPQTITVPPAQYVSLEALTPAGIGPAKVKVHYAGTENYVGTLDKNRTLMLLDAEGDYDLEFFPYNCFGAQVCLRDKIAPSGSATILREPMCVTLPSQESTFVGRNAKILTLIEISDAEQPCITSFTYDGTTYNVVPNICLKDAGEAFDGDYFDFISSFRSEFEVLTGETLPSITEWGFLISPPDYTGTSFSVATQDSLPQDITWDGANWWVVGSNTDAVYQYDSLGFTGTSFSVSSEETTPTGITWDGTHFWVVGSNTDAVYKYDASGTYTGTSFSVAAEETAPTGITWDGTHFWVVGSSTDTVYKYDASGTYTGTSFSVSNEHTAPSGITWDGTHFWVSGNSTTGVHQYDASGNVTTTSFTTATEDSSTLGITWDGDNLWTVGSNTDTVYEYGRDTNLFISDNGSISEEENHGTANLILLTALTMVNKNSFGGIVETKTDVASGPASSQYNTLTIPELVQSAIQTICYSGCDEISRKLESLTGDMLDPAFEITACGCCPDVYEPELAARVVNGSGTTATDSLDGELFSGLVEDYKIIVTAGTVAVTMPSTDTFDMTAPDSEIFGEGTERDVDITGLSVVGSDGTAEWRIVLNV